MVEATALGQAETLCRSLLDEKTKKEIEFFKCIKVGLCKTGGKGKITANEINAKIVNMLDMAIQQDGVFNIFEQVGKKIGNFTSFYRIYESNQKNETQKYCC